MHSDYLRGSPTAKDISGTTLNIDIEGADEIANLVATLDVPVINQSISGFNGGPQTETNPYKRYSWNKMIDGDNHLFQMDLFKLDWNWSIGIYASTPSEFPSDWESTDIWVNVIPRTWEYARIDGVLPLTGKPIFGLAGIEINEGGVEVKSRGSWSGDTPNYPWHGGLELSIYGQMEQTGISNSATFDWDLAQSYEGTTLNPMLFSDAGWYVPLELTRGSCSSSEGLFSFLAGYKVVGDVVTVNATMHVFVIGEWEVAPEFDQEWEGLDPYERHIAGFFDGLGSFFLTPFGLITTAVVLLLGLALLAYLGVNVTKFAPRKQCAMKSTSRRGTGRRQVRRPRARRALDIIREFRDTELKHHLMGKIVIFTYYYIFSPIVCIPLHYSERLRAFAWNHITLKASEIIGRTGGT
jgi:hypothetical protein